MRPAALVLRATHGILRAVLPPITVNDTTLGTTVGNLGFDEVRFPGPVFIGDTIRVQTEITAKRESRSRPDWGIVTFMHRGTNQRDEIICTCVRNGAILKKPSE